METNLDGVFYMTQALTPMLKETQGDFEHRVNLGPARLDLAGGLARLRLPLRI